MFRELRRKRQALSLEDCAGLLERGTSGVLALLGDDGYPYAVPLNYVYTDGRIYFHSARQGHKLDAIQNRSKASFCVIGQDRIVPQEYTSYFRSVIVFGTVRILEDETERRDAIEKLTVRYAPESSQADRSAMIDREWDRFCMLELTVDHMSGKEAIELVREKHISEI